MPSLPDVARGIVDFARAVILLRTDSHHAARDFAAPDVVFGCVLACRTGVVLSVLSGAAPDICRAVSAVGFRCCEIGRAHV